MAGIRPCRTALLIAVTGVALGGPAGCGPRALRPAKEHVPEALPFTWDLSDFETTLRENVRDGLVDYTHLSANREPLERFLAVLSAVGPDTAPGLFRDRQERVAYYMNAYNALALRFVLEEYPTQSVYAVSADRPLSFEWRYAFPVGGVNRTLGELEDLALTESGGDVRVLFGLCAAAMGCPPIPAQPIYADDYERTLRYLAASGVANPRLVRVDHGDRRLRVWVKIFSRRQQFEAFYVRRMGGSSPTLLGALLYLASPQQRLVLNDAVGYGVGVIPFDGRLNDVRLAGAVASARAGG